MTTPRIAFIGAGNMAASLIGGLLAQGLPASAIRASDRGTEQREKIAAEHGIDVVASNAEACRDADVIVLAVKPQVMKDVCLDLAPHVQDGQLIVSIAAGITRASLENWLGARAICAAPRGVCRVSLAATSRGRPSFSPLAVIASISRKK